MNYITITVYGLQTDTKISAIKALRSLSKAIEGTPLSLLDAKRTVEALMDPTNARTVDVFVPNDWANFVSDGLRAHGFVMRPPIVAPMLTMGG